MADIEDQPVMRRVENLVDGDRQLDDAKPGTQVTTRFRHRIDHLVAHFTGKLWQVAVIDFLQICGELDGVEQRRRGQGSHGSWLSLLVFLEGVSSQKMSRKRLFSSFTNIRF
ncbi:hypothetical protein D3C73_762930 [compost metagenome]